MDRNNKKTIKKLYKGRNECHNNNNIYIYIYISYHFLTAQEEPYEKA